MTDAPKPLSETTPEGEQIVTPGVEPITLRDRLVVRMASPLEPKRPQKPCDHGLFDMNARNQIDWIDEARKDWPWPTLLTAMSSPSITGWCDREPPIMAAKPTPPEPPARRIGRGLHPSREGAKPCNSNTSNLAS